LADAAVSVHDLSAYLGAEIPDSGDYESLGGLLIQQSGKVPGVGSRIEAFDLSFIVRDADEKRVAKVEIIRPRPLSELPPAAAPSEPEAPAAEATSDSDRPPSEAPGPESKRGPDDPRKIAAAT
jgi:hypothetical protein